MCVALATPLAYFSASTHPQGLMVLQSFFQGGANVLTGDSTVLGLAVLASAVLPVVSWWAITSFVGEKTTLQGTRTIHRLKTTLPLLGNTLDMLGNVGRFQEWIYDICKEYRGEPVLITSLGRPDLLVMCTTEAFEECLKTKFENFPKGPFQCENLEGILGNGIFAVDHAKWVHQRKTASNLFTARTIRDGMTKVVRKHTVTLRRMLQRASVTGEQVDLFKLFNRLTIEAFAEIGFGIEMNCLEAKEEHPFQTAFDSAQRALVLRFVRPSWFWKFQRMLGIGVEGTLQRDTRAIDKTVLDIIAKSFEKRQSGAASQRHEGVGTDIVSLFLDNFENSADSKDNAFDPKYLRDIVVNFLIAGRDTTAQALSWFFLSISRNPRVVTKIREEIAQVLPGLMDGTIETPSMEEVQQLTYLEAALKETLRLYPSVPFTTKAVENDIVLSDGTFIRKGSYIGLPSYSLGRMTHVWGEDATEFKPERWIDEQGKIHQFPPSKFVAFNAGPRLCLGINLAMMEMKIVVASLLSQLNVTVLPDLNVTHDFSLTLPVHGELLATVTKA